MPSTVRFRVFVGVLFAALMWARSTWANEAFCAADRLREESLKAQPELQHTVDAIEGMIAGRLQADAAQSFSRQLTSVTDAIVPVVVYVVHAGGLENIPDQQVFAQIAALNAAFSGHGVRFCLATKQNGISLPGLTPGIIRVPDPNLTNHVTAQEPLLKAVAPVLSSDKYLRIWVVNNIDANSGVLGYARFPGTAPPALDGIVIRANVFGNVQASCTGCSPLLTDYDRGQILVHEVGHYLNLYHPFQGGCTGIFAADCATQGDRVCDTPQLAVASSGCPAGTVISCNGTPALLDNEMDYTNDVCRNAFTPDQAARMLATLNTARQQLISPENLVKTGVACAGGNGAYFTTDNYGACTGQTVTFDALDTTGATYAWDFGDNTTGAGDPVTHAYSAPGTYNVTLTVTSGSTSTLMTQQVVASVCAPIAGPQANWYFGRGAALDFSSGAPVAVLNSGIHSQEACVTQSDAAGNLLFYSNSVAVFDRNHAQMPPGTQLTGMPSASNGAISIPDPSGAKRYYLIYRGEDHRLRYSIVDFTDSAFPNGKLVSIDTLLPGGMVTEHITAVPKCNGSDYWVIAGNFLVYSVTASGVALTNTQPGGLVQNTIGTLKASPDGTMLVQTAQGLGAALYDFNSATGTITLRSLLPNGHYGSSFSPNSRVLYTAGSGAPPQGAIYQYDLSAASPASTVRIVSTDIIAPYGFVSLELGPDQKLYASGWYKGVSGYDHLSVIHSPNALNTATDPNACGYQFQGQSLAGKQTYIGLPNMIDAKPPSTIPADFSFSRGACGVIQFNASGCASSYAWDFGDAATSNAQNPLHIYWYPGTFPVTLTLNGSTVVTHAVTIGPPASSATVYGPSTACLTSDPPIHNYSVNAQAGLTYAWTVNGGAISGPASNDNVDIQWGVLPGTLTVTVTDAAGCTLTNSITVTENCGGSQCVPPPPGLVDWWPFDETCGSMAEDIAGSVNNAGTYVHGPVPTTGVVGGALSFDGLDDYVVVADSPELNFYHGCVLDFAESLTIDAWIRTSIPSGTSPSSGVLTILDKRVNPSQPSGYHVFLYNGRLGFQIDGLNYVAPFTGPDSIDIADNQWHFVAVTLGMCRGGGGLLYVDGKAVRTLPPALGFVNTANLYIGARDPAFGGNYFPGAIDELEIFKGTRTEDELRAIFEARASGKCKTGCGNRTVVITPEQYELHWSEGRAPVLTADGGAGPYTFAVTSGALPAGILLSFDGRFYGVPSQSGTFPIAVTAADTNGCRGTQNYALVVN